MRFPQLIPLIAAVIASGAGEPELSAGSGHDVHLELSGAGIEVLETTALAALPRVVHVPELTAPALGADFTFADTSVRIDLRDLDVVPRPGGVELTVQFGADALGRVFADLGPRGALRWSCRQQSEVSHASATVALDLSASGGALRGSVRSVAVSLSPAEIDVELLGCPAGALLNTVTGVVRDQFADLVEPRLKELLEERVTEQLDSALRYVALEGRSGRIEYSVSIETLDIDEGLSTTALVSVRDRGRVAACVGARPGVADSVAPKRGVPPKLLVGGDVTLAVNLGLVEEVFHQLWRQGALCVEDAARRLAIDLHVFEQLVPAIPPGARLSLNLRFGAPPVIEEGDAGGTPLQVRFRDVDFDLVAHLPGGGERALQLDFSLVVAGDLWVDSAANAVTASLRDIRIEDLRVVDPFLSATDGFDPAYVLDRLERGILPRIVAELGAMEVAGTGVTGAQTGVILRDLAVNESHFAAAMSLVTIPTRDLSRPDTALVSVPTGTVSIDRARVVVSGSDADVPAELLRYQVTVDGAPQGVSSRPVVSLGELGHSHTYEVEVAAIDPAGNRDQTPVRLSLSVDGIEPLVAVSGRHARHHSPGDGPLELSWTSRDDLTDAMALETVVVLHRLPDPEDQLDTIIESRTPVLPGVTTAAVELPGSGLYRADIEVRDRAGNRGIASVLIRTDAGGCSVGAGTAGGGAPLLLVLLLLAARRRETL